MGKTFAIEQNTTLKANWVPAAASLTVGTGALTYYTGLIEAITAAGQISGETKTITMLRNSGPEGEGEGTMIPCSIKT